MFSWVEEVLVRLVVELMGQQAVVEEGVHCRSLVVL